MLGQPVAARGVHEAVAVAVEALVDRAVAVLVAAVAGLGGARVAVEDEVVAVHVAAQGGILVAGASALGVAVAVVVEGAGVERPVAVVVDAVAGHLGVPVEHVGGGVVAVAGADPLAVEVGVELGGVEHAVAVVVRPVAGLGVAGVAGGVRVVAIQHPRGAVVVCVEVDHVQGADVLAVDRVAGAGTRHDQPIPRQRQAHGRLVPRVRRHAGAELAAVQLHPVHGVDAQGALGGIDAVAAPARVHQMAAVEQVGGARAQADRLVERVGWLADAVGPAGAGEEQVLHEVAVHVADQEVVAQGAVLPAQALDAQRGLAGVDPLEPVEVRREAEDRARIGQGRGLRAQPDPGELVARLGGRDRGAEADERAQAALALGAGQGLVGQGVVEGRGLEQGRVPAELDRELRRVVHFGVAHAELVQARAEGLERGPPAPRRVRVGGGQDTGAGEGGAAGEEERAALQAQDGGVAGESRLADHEVVDAVAVEVGCGERGAQQALGPVPHEDRLRVIRFEGRRVQGAREDVDRPDVGRVDLVEGARLEERADDEVRGPVPVQIAHRELQTEAKPPGSVDHEPVFGLPGGHRQLGRGPRGCEAVAQDVDPRLDGAQHEVGARHAVQVRDRQATPQEHALARPHHGGQLGEVHRLGPRWGGEQEQRRTAGEEPAAPPGQNRSSAPARMRRYPPMFVAAPPPTPTLMPTRLSWPGTKTTPPQASRPNCGSS